MSKKRRSPRKHRVQEYFRRDGTLVRSHSRGQRIVEVKLRRVRVPKVLYHGTTIDNLESILKEGLLIGRPPTKYTREQDFVSDTWGNISLAKDKSAAIFFVVATQMATGKISRGAVMPPQVIIEINTALLDKKRFITRDLLGKKTGEYKYVGNIPPVAFSKVIVREFFKDGKHTKSRERVVYEG